MIESKIIEQYGYEIRLLSRGNEMDIQSLCERCSDFSELVEGRSPKRDAGRSILSDLPPNKELKDKYVFGVYKEKEYLIAVVDIVKDYKVAGEWMIGLLMIDPNERGKGLGRKLHEGIVAWIYKEKGKKLRIGVVEENSRGYKFWSDRGYIEVGREKQRLGNKEQIIISMELFIHGI